MRRPLIITLILSIILLFSAANAAHVEGVESEAIEYDLHVVIFKNEICEHCALYTHELKEYLEGKGVQGANIEEYNLINNPEARAALAEFNEEYGVPIDMQGHLTVILNDRFVIEGNVPIDMIDEVLNHYPDGDLPRMVVLQELMTTNKEEIKVYKVMDENNEVRECPISLQIDGCARIEGELYGLLGYSILPLVLTTGLIDGINPCAFAVLLFFIAFLYTVNRTRGQIYKVGSIYIIAIFLTYMFIGIGILQAIKISDVPHLAARIAAILILVIGAINIKDYFWYGRWFTLKVPQISHKWIKKLVHTSTIPSVFLVGVLVGLCTFPCTGGIYVAILGLLAVTTTYSTGMVYLLVYNVMFVIPLIVILVAASNPVMVKKMQEWKESEKKYMKLVSGVIMIGLALFILFGGII